MHHFENSKHLGSNTMSQHQAQRQKEAIGRRQFNISSTEKLIEHLSCKYKSKLSPGGSLWIFKGHFCYYSNLFGTETKIRLRISDITTIIPSGNSSFEINTKSNETHKFVGFPSKEKRDSVIQFITESNTKVQSPSVPQPILHKRPPSHSMDATSASHKCMKPDNDTLHKTASITPRPKPIPPSGPAPTKPVSSAIEDSNTPLSSSNGCKINFTINTSDVVPHSEQTMHQSTPLNPSKLSTRQSYVAKTEQIRHKANGRRKSSGGINYNNPPGLRLQPIESQQTLRLETPRVHSDSDDTLKRRHDQANKYKHERSYSIHSDDTHNNRFKSWSDSDMPMDDRKDKKTSKKTKHKKHPFGSAAWFDNIFNPKQSTKPPTKKALSNPASASLGCIPKQPLSIPHANTCTDIPITKQHDMNTRTTCASEEKEKGPKKAIVIERLPSLKRIPSSLIQYIDESYSNAPIHLGSFQDLDWKALYSDDFCTTPAKFFRDAFSASFVQKMHHTRGSKGLKIGKWVLDDDEKIPENQPKTYTRKVEYISKIKDPPPFMPSKTEVYEKQRFRFYGSNLVVLDAAIQTPNIKYGDYFIIGNRYIFSVSEADPNKTHMDVAIAFKWLKKTWFEKIISGKATSEATEGMMLFGRKSHELFAQKTSSMDEDNDEIIQKDILPSPRRRIIDKKVIDYFHTPQRKENVIVEEWIKPCVQIVIDVVRSVLDPSAWRDLVECMMRITDVEEDHVFTVKHYLMGIAVLMLVFVICNMCWIFLWIWYSSSLNNIIREQNQILQQQSDIFEKLLFFLQKEETRNCVDGVCN